MSEYYNNYNQPTNNPTDDRLDWNDTITKDAPEFILLPEGEYNFRVKSVSKGNFNGSDKVPPCSTSEVEIEIMDPQSGKPVIIKHRFFMLRSKESFISQFYVCIGMKKKEEPIKMNWPMTTGRTGRCVISQHAGSRGGIFNQVKRFLEPETPTNVPFTPGTF